MTPRTYDGLLYPLALTLALLATGCPGDDTSVDTESEGTTGTTGDTNPTTSPTTSPTTNPTDPDSTGTTTDVEDTTATDDTTTDTPPEGTCLGLDAVGNIDTVFSMGGPPLDTCDATPAPCGGDVVGTWDIETACGYDTVPNPLEDQCPGSTFALNLLDQSGTVTFEMDGSFTQDFNVDVEAVFGLDPMACFGVDCATFSGIVQMDDPDAACVDMMGTCTCTFPPDPPPPPTMGTYETMGDLLVLTVDGEVTELQYCVADSRLDTWSTVLDATATETACDVDQDCVDALGDMHQAYVCVLPE